MLTDPHAAPLRSSGPESNAAFESRLGKLARVLTGRYGIQVVLSADGPKVERERIVLPDYPISDTASKDRLIGYLDLLIARAKYSDLNQLARVTSRNARAVSQVVEDRRACVQLMKDYPGAYTYLATLRTQAAAQTVARWDTLSWRDKLIWRVERALWNEVPGDRERSPSLDAALLAAHETIEEARSARSSAESIRIATRLIAVIRSLAAGDVNNMMLSADASEQFDDDGNTPSETVGDDAEAAEALNTPPSGDSSLVAGMAQAPSNPDAEVSDSGDLAGSAAVFDSRPLLSIPLTTDFDVTTDLTGRGDAAQWHALRFKARAETAPLKTKLERALKADEQTHWKRERERGELDRPSLAKLATSPGYRTPFKTKRVTQGRDSAVTLLIDRSGSMAGEKIALARLCAAALCDALVQLNFPCEVLGYSSIEDAGMRAFYEQQIARGASMTRYNRFVERLDLQIYKRFGSNDLSGLAAIECGHENPDGEALAWAAQRLLNKKADRRILLVLSDGYPATGDGHPTILRTDLRSRIDTLTLAGIELIGVGILDDAVESFYPNNIVVTDLQELPTTAFQVLGQTLLRR